MGTKKISIIIPVYNVDKYLAECLDSAINQDYQNKEIIAINDGSTDNSYKILKEYKSKFPEIIIKNIKNQGLSIARNTGLEAATGDYVIFLDSDDWIEKNTLSTCIEKINEHKADIIFFSANAFIDGMPSKTVKNFSYGRPSDIIDIPLPSKDFFSHLIKSKNYAASACLYMYKKEKLGSIRFLPAITHEDNLFTTQLLITHNDIIATCISDKLFHRRVRPESIMTEPKSIKHIDGYFRVAEELLKNDIINEKSNTSEALNLFTQTMITNALSTTQIYYKNRCPLSIRTRALKLVRKLNPKHIKIKTIACCIAPEIITIKNFIKKTF